MAQFEPAFLETMMIEAPDNVGLVNHRDDPGGFTVYGIARRRHPRWPGWDLIDRHEGPLPKMTERTTLTDLVREFYAIRFWEPIWGDAIPEAAACIAIELYECGVNTGTATAVGFLQRALNVFNRKATLYPDLRVDMRFGPKTFRALEQYLTSDGNVANLYKVQNILQGAYYTELTEGNEKFESFYRGWLRRITVRHPSMDGAHA